MVYDSIVRKVCDVYAFVVWRNSGAVIYAISDVSLINVKR